MVATAFLLYSEDWNGRFPEPSGWMDGIDSYAKQKEMFRCPRFDGIREPFQYGYMYEATPGKENSLAPAEQVLVFETTARGRNLAARLGDVPLEFINHVRFQGNVLSFLDGHVRAVRRQNAKPVVEAHFRAIGRPAPSDVLAGLP